MYLFHELPFCGAVGRKFCCLCGSKLIRFDIFIFKSVFIFFVFYVYLFLRILCLYCDSVILFMTFYVVFFFFFLFALVRLSMYFFRR